MVTLFVVLCLVPLCLGTLICLASSGFLMSLVGVLCLFFGFVMGAIVLYSACCLTCKTETHTVLDKMKEAFPLLKCIPALSPDATFHTEETDFGKMAVISKPYEDTTYVYLEINRLDTGSYRFDRFGCANFYKEDEDEDDEDDWEDNEDEETETSASEDFE